eukprot:Em0022g970a
MEEESSDMDNVNDRYTLCTEEAEEQPTSAADDLHLEDRNVNVMENADAYQETEVVIDSDYDDLAFDCTGCSTPEGSKTGCSIQLIIKAPNESISFFTECNENKTEC